MLGSKQLEQELRVFKEKFGRNYFGYFLKCYGAFHLAEVAGIEVVRSALNNIEAERTMIWRAEKLLEETKKEIDLLKREENSKRHLELYTWN